MHFIVSICGFSVVIPSAQPHRPPAAVERRFELRALLQEPAVDGRVVDRYPAFLYEFFHLAVAQRIGAIPLHTREKNVLHKVDTLEADHHRSPLSAPWVTEGDHTRNGLGTKICDKMLFSTVFSYNYHNIPFFCCIDLQKGV